MPNTSAYVVKSLTTVFSCILFISTSFFCGCGGKKDEKKVGSNMTLLETLDFSSFSSTEVENALLFPLHSVSQSLAPLPSASP